MPTNPPNGLTRRKLLTASAATVAAGVAATAKAVTINGVPQWLPFDHNGPLHYEAKGWQFFTLEEAREVEAIVERLIPADDLSASGKEAGCAVFIDRQLASHYGRYERLYQHGPFVPGVEPPSDLVPAERYRVGIEQLGRHCQATFGKRFSELEGDQRDEVLRKMESGDIAFEGIESEVFFEQILQNAMEGFFADPIYGGNRDMVSWKMLGFPGARYDYRPYIDRHNEKLDLIPLSIIGSSSWSHKG
ncbi:gluconate 2-dehydrogenase subunit 3 family protein [Stutzerimonas stutzeri]|uniref:gluconate 2-dehydrogenase subunit 3 family protein n=1 Tax=Stutzerimonas stutzeri TaxID=316 RepID=UPI0006AC8DEB|nr:gluconate 2-dehydrogenase subunit 3 family protein [Stutzerimonas stutzeri]KOR10260.1 gluconate 2-dehydrogenase [Stutzerimonas stutzeri]MBH3353327.1 gluconate 2-dehydrogenase subunit 3 family protein [Stutzerimonas stutzeri]MDI9735659.1 gluconate 2-dehydrogenase subunit 3 family protein [Stutzerimonas stutzeri]RRV33164.1 gluconate 2-dehydrogenase subunit 3 family protein [Stutzerimonas stutzeri]